MLEHTIRKLKEINGTKISITLPSDEEGYFDRKCPSGECEFEFKILEEDWDKVGNDESIYCPFCHYVAKKEEDWHTKEQLNYAEKIAQAHVEKILDSALRKDAQDFNSSQRRDSLITMKMEVKGTSKTFRFPARVLDTMKIKICCPKCACHYSFIGAAFFCPTCGYNTVETNFENAILSYRKTIDAIPTIQKVLAEDKDTMEVLTRRIIENTLQNAVTTFQDVSQNLFVRLPGVEETQIRRNAFQNLEEGNELWKNRMNFSYLEVMSSKEWSLLKKMFQQRHLLAHTEGIVDENYLKRSEDSYYSLGQRIVVNKYEVIQLLDIIQKIVDGQRMALTKLEK